QPRHELEENWADGGSSELDVTELVSIRHLVFLPSFGSSSVAEWLAVPIRAPNPRATSSSTLFGDGRPPPRLRPECASQEIFSPQAVCSLRISARGATHARSNSIFSALYLEGAL